MKLTSLLLAGTLAVAGCASAPPPVSKIVNGQVIVTRAVSPDAYAHYARAQLYEEEQNWEQAAVELRRVLALDDQAPEVRAQLADVLLQLGEVNDAADQVERSLAIEPTVPGHAAAAHVAEARHEDKVALDHYRQGAALALADGEMDAIETTHLALASAQLAALDLPAAHATIRALADTDRDSVRARVELGAMAWAEGRLAEAEAALKEAIALEPEQLDARLVLAALQVATGRAAEAKAVFRDTLERSEDSLEVGEMYLKWLVASGDRAAADEEADRLTPDVIDETTIDAIVRIERAAGRPERARAAAERALERGVPSGHVALLVGGALADAKDYTGAAARLLKVPKGDPDYVESRLRAAEALRRGGGARQLEQAERALDDATAAATAEAATGKPTKTPTKTPADGGEARPREWMSDLIVARALLDEKRGDPTGALRGLDLALKAHPDDPRFLLVRAAIDERRGGWRAALAAAQKILASDPRNVEALNFAGFVAADHDGDLKQAVRQLQVAMVLDPGAGGIVDSLGWAYLRQGDLARASTFLIQGDRLEPGDPEILAHLAELYSRQNQNDRAVATFRRALEHDPDERVARDIQARLRRLEPAGTP